MRVPLLQRELRPRRRRVLRPQQRRVLRLRREGQDGQPWQQQPQGGLQRVRVQHHRRRVLRGGRIRERVRRGGRKRGRGRQGVQPQGQRGDGQVGGLDYAVGINIRVRSLDSGVGVADFVFLRVEVR